MTFSYRIVLSLAVVLALQHGVFVCCDDELFERGPPFDEDGEGLEECNDDSIICEVSGAVLFLDLLWYAHCIPLFLPRESGDLFAPPKTIYLSIATFAPLTARLQPFSADFA